MNAFSNFKSIMVGALALANLSAVAEAGTVADWNFSDDGATCSISTNNRPFGGDDGFSNNDSTFYFTISKTKNKPNSPVELMVQFISNDNKSTGAVASISGANSIAFADMDGRKSVLWAVPRNLSTFISQIKSGSNNFKVKSTGGRRTEDVKLTTPGFRDVLSQMESNCNGGVSLVNAEFESTFLANVPASIDPNRLDPAKTSQLRSVYYAAYNAAFNISNAANDLAKLLAKYQPYIDELSQNRGEATHILEVDLPNTRNTLVSAQKQQVDARTDIARIDSQIPGLNAKIEASQRAYDTARAVLAPLEPEFNRITGELSSAQSTLADAQNRLSYIDTRLHDGAQQISNLESEASTIEYRLPQKRNDLDRANSILRDAQSRRANFNVQWERESRLRNNFEYSRLQSDIQNLNNSLRQSESEMQRLQMFRDHAAQELQQCHAQPMVLESLNLNEPGNPSPPPPRDCSRFEQAYNNANMQLSQKENERRDIANRINNTNSRIYQIERQVDMDVRRAYDSLVYAEDQARRDYDRIQSDMTNDQNRLSQIRSADIPRLEREQSQLQGERPIVVSRISDSTSAVSRLTAELARFKTSNNWDRKAEAVNSTASQLSTDQSALRSAQVNKATAQRRLEEGAVTEAQAKTRIDSLNARIVVLNSRAGELTEILKKLPEERAQFDATLAAQRTEYSARQTQFADLLK